MAQQLTTNIVINATVGNGFSELGNTLTMLGSQVDQISQQLINFGKDSLNVYEEYEKSMAEAQVALSTIYGRNTKQLGDVMTNLDAQARDWASSTIFHTDDVANAITEAARAGWDYNQIMTGIPAAMQLAQAGSIDLSDSIYYITEAAKAGGIAFEDLGDFIDMWAFAANSSNGSIETFGDTMLRLGSVMQFAGSREELLSLIALMHDTGTEGSTAATLMRTAMMNILAPSGTAGKVLEELGATDEEIRSIRQDASKLQALNILGEHGFSAFDDEGQAKPILTIFSEMREVLGEIAGGYDKIDKNETTLGVLGTIFGKRGITGALNIMNMMEHAVDLENQLLNGEAEGYGEYAAETMMDTYYGAIETWQSKVERLKQRTGETLSEQLEPVLETLGGIVEDVSELDTGTFNALVAGFEHLAIAGPGMLLAGGAFRFAGLIASMFANPMGQFVLLTSAAVMGVSTLDSILSAFAEADYESKFGNLSLDNSQVKTYVDGMKTAFDEAQASISGYENALTTAVEKYTTASSELKSNLLTDMLTGTEIKEGSPEYIQLMGLGENMIAAVNDGILNNYASSMSAITQAYGDDPENIGNPVWAQIIGVMDDSLQDELGKAEDLGKKLRQAIMDGITNDGKLSAEEIANIQSIIDEQNELLAQQVDRERYLERERILRKAQTLGLSAIRESSQLVEEERDREWNDLLDRQNGIMYDVMAGYDRAIAEGAEMDEIREVTDENGNIGYEYTGRTIQANEEQKELARRSLEQQFEQQRYEWTGRFSDFLIGLWTEGITSSDLSGSWDALQALGANFRANGLMVTQDAALAYNDPATLGERIQAENYLVEMVERLGGREVLEGYYDYFASQGMDELASSYERIMDMYDAIEGTAKGDVDIGTTSQEESHSDILGTYEQIDALLNGASVGDATSTPEDLIDWLNFQREQGLNPSNLDWQQILPESLWSQFVTASSKAGFGSISDFIAGAVGGAQSDFAWTTQGEIERSTQSIDAWSKAITNIEANGAWAQGSGNLMYQLPEDQANAQIEAYQSMIQREQANISALLAQTGTGPITAYSGGGNAAESLREQGAQVQVDGDTQQLVASIEAENGQELMTYVDGDATELHMRIWDEDGQTLVENVTGDASQLESIISNYNGKRITLQLSGQRMFAEGGRATEASIFGEGDTAEWAIPEEHTERTAELLDAARAASGFTWPELLARNGGLNANPGRAPMTLVYSPTIYAQDAEGVAEKLDADKARMEKWYAEKQMLDGVEVYA